MKGDGVAWLAALAGLAIALTSQLPGRVRHEQVKETTETYLLPPPEHLVVMSLGYRSALADVLWANILVTQGLRLGERRRFDIAIEYLDAVNELDPKWREPYKLADSLVTLQAKATPLEQVRGVRRILERGVRERPNDAELWLILGQFTGQIAPGTYLDDVDPVEAQRWREEGSEYLARAAELAPPNSNIAWQAMGAGRVFANSGRLDRAIEMFSAILATTDDPELRERVEALLEKLQRDTGGRRSGKRTRVSCSGTCSARLTGASRSKALLLGPGRDPAACAGGARSRADERTCPPSWTSWWDEVKRRGAD
jgi:tetratricopeptide (TPR) repeat protein